MNMALRSLNRQTILAVAVFFAVLIGACVWGVSFVVANHQLQGEFETKNRVLDELKKRAVAAGVVDGAAADTRGEVISAPTETLAASELHRRILATLEGSGGAVHSIQAEATTDSIGEGLRRLNAQVAFDSSMELLQKILFRLETAIPFVLVESIVVQPAPAAAPGGKIGDPLRVTMSVSSYWRNSEASSGGVDQKNRS